MHPISSIGIDPGARGAVALRRRDRSVLARRLPAVAGPWGATVDADALYNTLLALMIDDPTVIVIEKVGGMRGQSASAAFTFGATCGVIHATVCRLGLPVVYVDPRTWRAKLGVYGYARAHCTPDAKTASRAIADANYPQCSWQWAAKGAVDLAEAALIAEFGIVTHGVNT
jgi:hypothetical protein